MDHVARNQAGRSRRAPNAVAEHARCGRQSMPQELKRLAGAAFLHEADQSVDAKQHRDDRRLPVLSEQNLEQDGYLQHPWERSPEFLEKRKQQVAVPLGNLVRSILVETTLRLGLAQTKGVTVLLALRRGRVHTGFPCLAGYYFSLGPRIRSVLRQLGAKPAVNRCHQMPVLSREGHDGLPHLMKIGR